MAGFHPITFLLTLISFLLFVYILARLLTKPVTGMMDARTKRISDALEEADKARTEATELQKQYAEQLKSARNEVQEILNRANKQAELTREEILGKAKEETHLLVKRAQEEITRERDAALATLRNEVAGLAIAAAGKVLERTLDEAAHTQLIDDFISKAGELPC